MKNMLCVLFGHVPEYGYYGEGEGYFDVKGICVDGINSHHASLLCNCERCGENFKVGNIHIPQEYVKNIPKLITPT